METTKTAISMLDLPQRILLGPGPSLADPRVLQAMTTPLLGHLDPAFLGLMDRIQELLRYTFETGNRLTISSEARLPASGHSVSCRYTGANLGQS